MNYHDEERQKLDELLPEQYQSQNTTQDDYQASHEELLNALSEELAMLKDEVMSSMKKKAQRANKRKRKITY